jgi:citronellol/citronellal dehydrogenase
MPDSSKPEGSEAVAIVTGGARGIGWTIAGRLAAEGWAVGAADLVPGNTAEGASPVAYVALDVRDQAAVDATVIDIASSHGRLDLLVNNAGGQFLSPAEAITPKGFRTVIELNVQGTWLMTHAAATKAFIPQREGKVVSVTLSPHQGMPGMVHSGAARAAVENMMRTLSIEWARFNVKLCAVAAGQFDTEVLRTKYPQPVAENVHRTVPLGRLGTPEEMAWLIAYIASPAGDFLSGCVITIDGARDNWFGTWPPGGASDEAGEPLAEERRPKD